MSCFYCKQQPKDDKFFNSDCVLSALENIRQHYLSFKNAINVRDKELQKLQQRNEKLSKAVELLQQDQLRASLSSINHESSPRRHEISLRKSIDGRRSHVDIRADTAPFHADLTADDLNMALNSEQILSCSSADTSTQLTPNHTNESINATEKVNSPRVLRTSFEKRRELFKKQRSPSPFKSPLKSNENIAPSASPISGAVRKANTCWMSKEREVSNNSFGDTNVKKAQSFAKPQAVNFSKVERKPSLSLKKPPKLKQTRLKLDLSRDKSSGSDSTFCEDVIDASPNPNAMKKQEKPSRSWLLRVNSSVKNANSKADQSDNAEGNSIFLVDDDFEDVFDFSLKPSTPQQKKSSNEMAEVDDFKQPNSLEKVVDSMHIKESDSNSPSVMILTPATQDIIFLDDTWNDDNDDHIESMDLLKELMKNNDESLDNLRRIEGEKIKKLQRTASAAPKLEKINVATKQQIPLTAEPRKMNSFPAQASTAKQTEIKVKQEKISQEPTTRESTTKLQATKRKSKEISSEEEEEEKEDENLMPQPFIVKQEKMDDVITKKVPELRKKLSIKVKFNIDCKECEQYINFLGDCMTDKEIMEHLQRCTRHQRNDDRNSTPDGFWDPFIATLDSNDPRNETLIDTRFCNKKK